MRRKIESDFQKKVFNVVREIPRGRVMTYKKVAGLVGRPKAWRAVGNALNKNRSPEIPCHRVILSSGRAGGYAKGTKRKIYLLSKEGVIISR
jgi:methylated-DNA-[protein]-cysteine S-methyltransferase